MQRVPLSAGGGVARTRASRRDVRRRATPDITGLCTVAARLSSAASPGEGGAAFPGRATGDKDDPQWTIQRQSRRFRFAASPVTGDAGPGLPFHRPSLFRGPRGCSYPEAAKRPWAARPLSHVKQVGPGPRPVPGCLLRPFRPQGPPRGAAPGGRGDRPCGGGGASSVASSRPSAPRSPPSGRAIKNVDGRTIFLIFKLLSWSP